jgi:hypothetical protein
MGLQLRPTNRSGPEQPLWNEVLTFAEIISEAE